MGYRCSRNIKTNMNGLALTPNSLSPYTTYRIEHTNQFTNTTHTIFYLPVSLLVFIHTTERTYPVSSEQTIKPTTTTKTTKYISQFLLASFQGYIFFVTHH